MRFVSQPFSLGRVRLKNRFVMPPMVTHFATSEGYLTERQIAYYKARAEGGVGLIIVEATAVSPEGRGSPYWLSLHEDRYIPPLRDLTRIAHQENVPILLQLAHAGRQTRSDVIGCQPVAPSPIACNAFGEEPRELTAPEIRTIQLRFVEAAQRAYEAGFDGVEIHGAHGYLVHQFLSERTNHRQDEYGGDLLGRVRFLEEIVLYIRQELPSDFVVGCRLNGDDYVEGGLGIGDTVAIAARLASRGISYVHISCGVAESIHMTIPPMDVEPGFLVPLAETLKKAVCLPVIAVGRIGDPLLADSIIKEGKADLVAVGRALWADPKMPRKALEGRFDEIRPCIGCNQGCRRKGTDRCCLMNPEAGREGELTLLPAKNPKKIAVIGGGPAGMEFASVAALRGHKVTLFERSPYLGGKLRLASIPPKRGEIMKAVEYFEREIKRMGVQVEKGRPVTVEEVSGLGFDEIVLASGAPASISSIPGAESIEVLSAEEVLLEKSPIGNRVLIVGGGMVGCEIADFLSSKGKNVILMERLPDVAPHIDPPSTMFLRKRLQDQGVEIRTSCEVKRILANEVVIEKDGLEERVGPVDTIILATGYRSKSDAAKGINLSAHRVHVIGDALEPRDALWAIYEGSRLARKV
jgi:2,4-dienoyl-CoA reductase-like NADH-dependent reductase (Old Yellow Enzyme family)/NADH dehydrogenase FAD-containing subunit